jgi:preprotein translocase subunit SecA
MRIFAGERLNAIMVRLKMPEGEAIEHAGDPLAGVAQRKVEQRNFDIRKQLLEYDDVANDQRKVIYQQRNELLESDRHHRDHHGDAPGRAGTTSSASYVPVDSRRRAVGPSRRSNRRSLSEYQLKLPVASG